MIRRYQVVVHTESTRTSVELIELAARLVEMGVPPREAGKIALGRSAEWETPGVAKTTYSITLLEDT